VRPTRREFLKSAAAGGIIGSSTNLDVIASLSVTNGRRARTQIANARLRSRLSASRHPTSTRTPARRRRATPRPSTSGLGSRQPTTTRRLRVSMTDTLPSVKLATKRRFPSRTTTSCAFISNERGMDVPFVNVNVCVVLCPSSAAVSVSARV
jgi:hypothetical protein